MFTDPQQVGDALTAVGYLPDLGVATAAYLALSMRRPLFLEGDPGVGKTALAQALAQITNSELVKLQCYEGIDVSQALYDWNFPRQILHLRAASDRADTAEVEASLYRREFLIVRPILRALESGHAVLLIDEIDRADDEFEAFLLEMLAENAVTIPELGTIRAQTPPLVVLTSNRTREVHDALKRRCLYHWVEHPELER
jgi:MoxR-like ATPase